MTKGTAPKQGRKFAKTVYQRRIAIPNSCTVGKDSELASEDKPLGEGCVIGNESHIERALGNQWTVGDRTHIGRDGAGWRMVASRPSNVTIGNDTEVRDGVWIASGVQIGNNVTIERGVDLRPGVIIPDNWRVPEGCIVNPGPDGYPAVMPPPVPQFRCNVALRNEGYRY